MPDKNETASDQFLNHPAIKNAGTIVFILSSVSVMVTVILGISLDGEIPDNRLFRAAEIIVSVGALGLIVSFLSGTSNAFAILLTLLVISALIIPSKDIVRFVLVLSGSERDIDDYYGASSNGTNITGRVEDLAVNIALIVEKELRLSSVDFEELPRDRIVRAISASVTSDRAQTILERVRSRGAFELLSAAESADDLKDFLYHYRTDDRLEVDVRFLRSEGLISMSYLDLDSIQLTDAGQLVLARSRGADDAAQTISRLGSLQAFGSNSSFCASIDWEAIESAPAFDVDTPNEVQTLRIEGRESVGRLRVLPGEIGTYEIDVDIPGGDPIVRIPMYQLIDERPDPASCEVVGSDDDGGAGLASLLSLNLGAGRYILGVEDLDVTGIPAQVRIAKSAD